MKLLRYFSLKPSTASIARDRLQIIVSHQQLSSSTDDVDYIELLRQELMDVVARYVQVDENQVNVRLEKAGQHSILEMNILLPAESSIIKE